MLLKRLFPSSGSKKAWFALAYTLLAFCLIEGALQFRLYLKEEDRLSDRLLEEDTVVFNEEFQLNLLRPSSVSDKDNQIIKSNSFGLRSPEISLEKRANELRVAVLGASTVMGHTNPVNEETLPYRIQDQLEQLIPNKKINVINAGINGFSLFEQKTVFDKILKPLNIDLLVWYTGFNDIAFYCTGVPDQNETNYRLVDFKLPNWILTSELLVKNTEFVREIKAESDNFVDPAELDLMPYRERLQAIVEAVNEENIPILMVANTRAFRRDMPREKQIELAEFSQNKSLCFDIDGLQDVYDMHNDEIINVSNDYNLPILRLDQIMPAGDGYFDDSIHFTLKGNDFVADLITKKIAEEGLLNADQFLTRREVK